MKKIYLFLLSAIAILALNMTIAFAATHVGVSVPAGISADAPFAGQFWLEDGSNSYILLDEKDGKYMILCGDSYGTSVFDEEGSQKIDFDKKGNIGYFIKNGVVLPQNIEKYIVSTDWNTEAGVEKGDCPEDSIISSKINILSATEFNKYYKKFGYSDMIGGDWWLRSPEGTGGDPSCVLFCSETGEIKTISAKNEKYVRPVFWVDKAFFEKEKLETVSMGTDVKKVLNLLCNEAELKKIGYSDTQISTIKNGMPGITEKVEYIEPKGYLYKILNLSDNEFCLKFYTNGQDAAVYKIQYTFEGQNPIEKNIVVSGDNEYKFELPAKYGSYQLNIQVFSGSRRVYNKNHTVGYMKQYKPQFMEYYSRNGVSTHGWRSATPHNDTTWMSDQDLDYMEAAGIKYYRDELPWNTWEYSYGWQTEDRRWWIFPKAEERNIKLYNLLTGTNYLYRPEGTSSDVAPMTRKMYEGFANYAIKNQTEKPGEVVEIFNEPNIPGFWKPTPSIDNYTSLLKTTYSNLKLKFPDLEVYAFSTSGTDLNYINGGMERGAYPYCTGIAFHPYCYPREATTADGSPIYNNIKSVYDIIIKNGGWKDMSLSETGWPTAYGLNNQEEQARNLVEFFAIGDWMNVRYKIYYDLQNDGTSLQDNESQFGLYDLDNNIKKGFVALNHFNTRLAGAIFHSKITLSTNDYAFMYSKDKKPVILAWNPIEETEYDFGRNVVVYDLYGNVIECENGKFKIGKNPIYITELGDEWFIKADSEGLRNAQNKWLKDYTNKIGYEKMIKFSNVFKNGCDIILQGADSKKMKAIIDEYTELGNDIYEAMEAEDMTAAESFAALYELHNICEYLYKHMMILSEQDSNFVKEAQTTVSETEKTVTPGYERIYSSGILRFAKRAFSDANDVSQLEDNPAKSGIVAAWNLKAINLIKWYDLFYHTEQENNLCVDLVWDDMNKTGFDHELKTFNFSCGNYSDKNINASVEIYDEKGECIGRSGDKVIESKSSTSFAVEATIEKDGINDKKALRCRIVSDGEIIYEYPITLQINDLLLTELVPAEQPVEQLKTLKIKASNPYEQANSATVEVSCPYIKFTSNSITIKVDAGTTSIIEYNITNIQNTEYHYYPITISMFSEYGDMISQKTVLWNFHVITKAQYSPDVSVPPSNIDKWKDAYPIYIDMPATPESKDAWKSSEASARVLTMWDENNMYMLADVYDHLFRNVASGSNIWQGDSIQIAIDSTLARGGYGVNCTEAGIALTPYGTNVYAWYSANGAGNRPDSNGTVMRNEASYITRYQLKVPVEDLKSKEIVEGKSMGLNIGINDSDEFLRDYMTQYSQGLVESKAPEKYNAFKLVSENLKASVKTENPFTTILTDDKSSESESVEGFKDINGHWAYEQIMRLVSKDIVKGMSETEFNPEGIITRAEYIAMVQRAAGMDETSYKGGYSDVLGSDWYSGIVQSAIDAGIIDEHYISDSEFFPNIPITREEMAVILYNVDKANSKIFPNYYNELFDFSDKDEISDFAKEKVGAMYMDDVISGYDDFTFRPHANATRAEAATILYNYIMNKSDK